MNASAFGEPVPGFRTWFLVASEINLFLTVIGFEPGNTERYRAAMPVTCGAAMEVPLMTLVAVSVVCQEERTLTPGANRSRHPPQLLPQLLYEALESLGPVAPTVIALNVAAGLKSHASALSLPAETE